MRPQVQILLAPPARRPPVEHDWGSSAFPRSTQDVIRGRGLSPARPSTKARAEAPCGFVRHEFARVRHTTRAERTEAWGFLLLVPYDSDGRACESRLFTDGPTANAGPILRQPGPGRRDWPELLGILGLSVPGSVAGPVLHVSGKGGIGMSELADEIARLNKAVDQGGPPGGPVTGLLALAEESRTEARPWPRPTRGRYAGPRSRLLRRAASRGPHGGSGRPGGRERGAGARPPVHIL